MNNKIEGRGNISAKVIADSVSEDGVRLTTMQLCYPRFIHGEFMTHRMFSRNAMSSRAVPVEKMIEQVNNNPAAPIHWGANQAGMVADEEIRDASIGEAIWWIAADTMTNLAERMNRAGLHKQVVNRILEPFQVMHTVVTATEWDNFFALRLHNDAQPEIYELARVMQQAMEESSPQGHTEEQWHMPYIQHGERMALHDAIKCSVARCARVSYLNHDQSQPSIEKDLKLYQMLYDSKHLSPFEHQAKPIHPTWLLLEEETGITHMDKNGYSWSGNFKGWAQYRNLIN